MNLNAISSPSPLPLEKNHQQLIVPSLANRRDLLRRTELACTCPICPPPIIALTTYAQQNVSLTVRPWEHRTISILRSEPTKLYCKPVFEVYVGVLYPSNRVPLVIMAQSSATLYQSVLRTFL